ncbi:MAG TPA: hypothetical protein PKK74_09150 [Candidatus Methanoculleus thermohydrogenotrophicum]|nr:hypothetical protein [Candidatus Methanoculleus thermohydrogenotrophicum]HOB18838.1 hypothetical protein [Candidatus Methanoculleus thermohydrogenotrophicum]HPZ38875.1 hypothetical protein [Candidatus Methanoculleus thermohydrogenotrophicum]
MEKGEAEHPRIREIASFVGIENILDGVVVRNEDGHATVDLGGQVFEAAGEEATLCIRSDDNIILGGDPGARNSMTGTVTRIGGEQASRWGEGRLAVLTRGGRCVI